MFLSEKVGEDYARFSNSAFDGELNKKTAELIALACSMTVDCTHCIEDHYKKAVEAGASKAELQQVAALVMAVSAGNKKNKHSEIIEQLDHDLKLL